MGLLTPPEMARKCNQIAYSNPGMAVIADADTGGGNVLNVQRTVRQLISNGCKGCVLEDQKWPKKSGHMREKSVETMEEFAAKVSAARAAIGDADFFLIARTVLIPACVLPWRVVVATTNHTHTALQCCSSHNVNYRMQEVPLRSMGWQTQSRERIFIPRPVQMQHWCRAQGEHMSSRLLLRTQQAFVQSASVRVG